MKPIKILISILFMTSLLIVFEACKEDELTPNEKTEDLLTAHTWELIETKIDGVVTNYYDGMTLRFDSKTYQTTNGRELWPASGTWEFVGDDGDRILRDDGLVIDLLRINETELVMSFYWETDVFDGGRVKSVTGLHVMTFRKKT